MTIMKPPRNKLARKNASVPPDFINQAIRIRKLLNIAEGDRLTEELMLGLSKFVQLYRERTRDECYYKRAEQAALDLLTAAEYIASATKSASRMDSEHSSQIALIVAPVEAPPSGMSFSEVLNRLERSASELRHLSTAIQVAIMKGITRTRKGRKVSRRGRPPIKYVDQTMHLITFYEKLTGKKVVSPRGVSKDGEAHQVSTEFIRLALKLIDPDIRTAQAITCIKNAVKLIAEINTILQELSPPSTSLNEPENI
jgi:hypothetical protein